jgi:putative spermidine/putrescine transport system ATP-binding protein
VARIQIDQVTKRFGPVTAVDRMQLDLQEGELIAFLGPSGCGKTTTLRMVAGFEVPTEGRILFGEREVTHLAPEKRNVGMVFQNYALFPHMTVAQNVAYGLQMRRVNRAEIHKRVETMLKKVQLTGLDNRYARQISGGQQQRTALARALVINPSVLLLDEPLANLDAKLREEMRFYIRELQRDFEITTVYVTHDQAEALVLADRIAVMMDGKLHQLDTPKTIYERPASARVAAFIGLTNLIPGEVQRRDGEAFTLETRWGQVACKGPSTLSGGDDVLLCVRPEALEVARAPSEEREGFTRIGSRNRVVARVTERAYLGSLIDYRLTVGNDLTLRAQTAGGHEFDIGDRLSLGFDATRTWIVKGRHDVPEEA